LVVAAAPSFLTYQKCKSGDAQLHPAQYCRCLAAKTHLGTLVMAESERARNQYRARLSCAADSLDT
ncbi:hypothetical protein, partial [Hyphomonas adhaerens]|uniref:hypothetical protein n=1 Tax=Hyphomonas adhaerens TaxID=81029 RepID=UPI00235474FC